MRWRSGFVWALGGSACLAFLLLLTCHPAMAAGTPSGMSAPPAAPTAAFESANTAQSPQPQFDWHGFALRSGGFSTVPVDFAPLDTSGRPIRLAPRNYGPLHRRPPPKS